MNNPKIVCDTILENNSQEKVFKMYPMTVARYCLLELTNSPFVKQNVEYTAMNLLPSFYIMTNDISELKKYSSMNIDKLIEKAMEFGETTEMKDLSQFVDAMLKQINDMNKISPEVVSDGKTTMKGESPDGNG